MLICYTQSGLIIDLDQYIRNEHLSGDFLVSTSTKYLVRVNFDPLSPAHTVRFGHDLLV